MSVTLTDNIVVQFSMKLTDALHVAAGWDVKAYITTDTTKCSAKPDDRDNNQLQRLTLGQLSLASLRGR